MSWAVIESPANPEMLFCYNLIICLIPAGFIFKQSSLKREKNVVTGKLATSGKIILFMDKAAQLASR